MSGPCVISVCHQKGGVAKTTTVATLGACLGELDQSILLIDLDPSSNLTSGLGINPAEITRSTGDVLLGECWLAAIIRSTQVTNIDLAPSNAHMGTAARFLHIRPNYEQILATNIRRDGLGCYDYILLDCPPSLGAVTISALVASDIALVPVQCEFYSVQLLNRVFKTVEQIREKSNPRLRLRLLVTMFDGRGNLHNQVLRELKNRYASNLLETVIGFDSNLRKSQFAGEPVTRYAPTTRAAIQYRELSRELMSHVKECGVL